VGHSWAVLRSLEGDHNSLIRSCTFGYYCFRPSGAKMSIDIQRNNPSPSATHEMNTETPHGLRSCLAARGLLVSTNLGPHHKKGLKKRCDQR